MGRKLRVLHVTQFLDIGGLETVIIELCRRLDRSRFEVEALCLNGYDPDYVLGLEEGNVPLHLLPRNNPHDLRYYFRVADFIRERHIDILHAHSGCFLYAALFARLAGVKRFYFTAHGLPVENGLKALLEDNLASLFCDAVVPVSAEVGDVLARRMPLAGRKMVPILNGIDTDRFCPCADMALRAERSGRYGLPSDAFLVGSVGRLEPIKNYAMLLQAFAQLAAEGNRVPYLVLVGEGSKRRELELLARDLGITRQVLFLGMQYRVQEILPLFDVFCLSSLSEGTSISLLEAQACGLPAVVTDVGGNGAVVLHGESGFLCSVNDDRGMADAIRRLRDDPVLARRMGAAGRQRVSELFSLESMVRRYEELYLKAILGN